KNLGFSPANYLATYMVEEFGYAHPKQQHIDLFEEKIKSVAAMHQIPLDTIPNDQQIECLFSEVQAYIDLDKVYSA
ncbi:MAG: hypothetical protein ABSF18_05215, partial [Gammaproteobacteria bacterium]